MRNNLYLALLSVLLLSGCMDYFTPAKPTINVYYIQDENKTNYPRVKTQGEHVSINTSPTYKEAPSKKIQLYFVYRDNCPACKQLKQVMRRSDIEAILNKDFEITRVNIRDKEALPKVWMHPFRTPTLYYMGTNQEELISSTHNMTARRFKATLLEAIQAQDLK